MTEHPAGTPYAADRGTAAESAAAHRHGPELTPREVGLEDRCYWADLYAGDDD